MLTGSFTSRRKPRRRAVTNERVTFRTFIATMAPNSPGERSASRLKANAPINWLKSLRFRGLFSRLALALALTTFSYFMFPLLTPLNVQRTSSESLESVKTEQCPLRFSATVTESRAKTNFGGIIVETGEIYCDGHNFTVTQITNSVGRALSVKKKRA